MTARGRRILFRKDEDSLFRNIEEHLECLSICSVDFIEKVINIIKTNWVAENEPHLLADSLKQKSKCGDLGTK